MRRQLKNSSPALCFLCLLVILQPKVTKTEKCPGSQEKSQDSIVDISLDPKSSLWTSPGTYQTVEFHLNATENRPVQISYSEKFPSKGHHATFVTALRPSNAQLSSTQPVKVTLTIFAPTYVPNGSRVRITLIVRDKPKTSSGAVLGLKAFLFSVTNLALNQIDHDPPTCQNSFTCSDFVSQCQNSVESCENDEFHANILVQDELTGIRTLTAKDHKVLTDLMVGNVNELNVSVTGDCCHPNVIMNLTDVAGNSQLCRASVNHANPVIGPIYSQIILLFIVIVRLCIA